MNDYIRNSAANFKMSGALLLVCELLGCSDVRWFCNQRLASARKPLAAELDGRRFASAVNGLTEPRRRRAILSDSASWTQQEPELSAADGAPGDYFGASVGESASVAVVGAPKRPVDGSPDQGAAYVFEKMGSADWAMQGSPLTAADGAPGDTFGLSVAATESTIVVGAPGHEVDTSPGRGAAYVFVRSTQGWSRQGEALVARDGAALDAFGSAVALSGDTILVGAPFRTVEGNAGRGAAYVFVRSGETWAQQGPELVAADGRAGDAFGSYVALSDDTALVGAPVKEVGDNPYQGAAYVFVRTDGAWAEQAQLIAPDGGAFDQLGPCAVSGDTALLGVPFHTVDSKPVQGAAYVFGRADKTWTTQGPALTAQDGAAGDQFGNAVSLAGDRALIAAWQHATAPRAYRGAGYAFTRSGSTWTQDGVALTANDGASNEVFGTAVALSGDTAMITAPSHRVGANAEQGAAYAFIVAREKTAGDCACRAVGARRELGSSSWSAWTWLLGIAAMQRLRRAQRWPTEGRGQKRSSSATRPPAASTVSVGNRGME